MPIKTYSPEEAKRLVQLASSNLRPKTIVAARLTYEADLRAAIEKEKRTGIIDREEARRLANVRLGIDAMYDRWAAGEFAGDELVPDPFQNRL